MALFQPTNQIPSSFTQVAVDVNDTMEISWQVNGNSAMIAFQIDFYLNDYASTYVTSTGRLTDGCPFYGTDRFGRVQFFNWDVGKPWADWSKYQLTNGNNYKFKITQWYDASENVVSFNGSGNFEANTDYFFQLPSDGYLKYRPMKTYDATSSKFYYNVGKRKAWAVKNNILTLINVAYLSSLPEGASVNAVMIEDRTASTEDFVSQTSDATFITRDMPTLTLYQTDKNYQNPIALTNTLATSIGYFKAEYKQEQGVPIRWIRWQVATANNGIVEDILVDTGDIYTPTLEFEYNGFFNEQQYAIRAICESESEQVVGDTDTSWYYFTIKVEDPQKYTGTLTAKCLNKENATLLQWDGVTVITGEYVPPESSQEQYTFSNGAVELPANSSIIWDNLGKDSGGNNQPMNFPAPWTVVWRGAIKNNFTPLETIKANGSTVENTTAFAFSPDGKVLIIGKSDASGAAIFSVDGNAIKYIGDVPQGNQGETLGVTSLAFSPDGTLLIIGYSLNNQFTTIAYTVEGTNITILKRLVNDALFIPKTIAFSPDGKMFIVGGGYALQKQSSIFTVEGTDIAYLRELPYGGDGGINTLAFSPDGSVLVAGTYSGMSVYSVSGSTISYKSGLADKAVSSLAFSPNGKLLVAGTSESLRFYAVDNADLTLLSEVNRLIPQSLVFSPDGKTVAIGVNNGIEIYFIDKSNNVSYATYENVGSTDTLAFSPDGKMLVSSSHNQALQSSYDMGDSKLLQIDVGQSGAITLGVRALTAQLAFNNEVIFETPISNGVDFATFIVGQDKSTAFLYKTGTLSETRQLAGIETQQAVTSIAIYGGDSGATVNNVSLYNNEQSSVDISTLYQSDSDFEPSWDSNDYKLYMTANFNNNLESGTGTGSGNGFRIYRQEYGKNVLTPIATVPSTTTSLKDYGITSRKAYKYFLYAYDTLGAFMSAVEADKLIATSFNSYSLLVCDYDEKTDEYHVRKQYLFALNLTDSSVSNNNSPTLNANFTPYPTRMPSTQNYASGTLQGLIGAIYTVPALIEQIGNCKWTSKPSTMDYFDSVDLEKELYDLSVAPYQLFLRDMKGHLRMVHTSSAISMSTNIKQRQQSSTISLPWVEIGDASDVTIIQTPEDYGWNSDEQVLDISLNVDASTGELSATYPFPYNGTRFILTGVNKENLTATTPLGVMSAKFNLSDSATKPTDGVVTAKVKTK